MSALPPLPLPESAPSEEIVLAALERFRPRLRRLFGRYQIPFVDSEDLAQDIALIALRSAGASRDIDGWLVGVALNQCRRYWKKRFRQEKHSLDSVPEPSVDSDEDLRLGRIDFERGLATLPPLQGKALHLVASGYSRQESAELVGYSPTSFRKLLQRSRQRLALRARAGCFSRARSSEPTT